MESNNIEELAVNVEYCPYCGSNVIEAVSEVDMYCMDCGRDFKSHINQHRLCLLFSK